mmetsp:Transcript_12714/g.26919  ORF Transcript_12714/g.26919 Transcript_12714/m.26919 type:complete len:467 (-) Transcript_12714:896-2296(-)
MLFLEKNEQQHVLHKINGASVIFPARETTCTAFRFFTTDSSNNGPQNNIPRFRRHVFTVTIAATAAASIYTRYIRREKLSTLIPAKDSGLLSADVTEDESKRKYTKLAPHMYRTYNLPRTIETITRAGLVGSKKSVKEELDDLRKWHVKRGYNGGLVVRDLTRPLFSINIPDYLKQFRNDSYDEDDVDSIDDDAKKGGRAENDVIVEQKNDDIDINLFNQRECYYLYYEIFSNGETRQQIFCRGTTLLADVWTCLKTWFVYDEELGCHVHYGFNQHANRIVEDVMPLLVPPPMLVDKRGITSDGKEPKVGSTMSHHATVEVCGHSLGGAVAMLVAIKLRKRGYIVTRAISLAGPRFCKGLEEREKLEKWLPEETLRIESDLDIVTYLPPNAVSVGDKLLLVDETNRTDAFMLPVEWIQEKARDHSWVESVWLNLRLFESLRHQNQTHHVSTYVKKLEQLVEDLSSN